MGTKQMTFRLGEETIAQLNYLVWVTRAKSQADMVRTIVGLVAEAVAGTAGVSREDPGAFYNGGTVLSEAEQRAYQEIVRTLQRSAEGRGGG